MNRILRILFFIYLSLCNTLFANQNLANEVSTLTASAVYDLDTQRLPILLETFLKQHREVQGIQIIDSISNGILIQYYRDKNKLLSRQIPKVILTLSNAKTEIIYNNEIIGRVIIYYDNEIVNENKSDPFVLTQKEQNWLNANPIQRIGLMSYWPHDKNNNSLHTELLKLINETIGTSLTPIFFDAWKDGFEEATKGNNLYGIMGLSWSKEREEKYFFYSSAYNFTPCYLVTRQEDTIHTSLKDFNDGTLYLKKEEITHKMVEGKNIKVIDMATLKEMCQGLANKKEADGFLSYFVDEEEIKKYNLKIAEVIYDKYGEVSIGIHHKYPELYTILQKAYQIIPKEKIAKLRNTDWEQKEITESIEAKSEVSFIGILTLEEGLFFIFLFFLLLYLLYLVYSKSDLLNIKFKLFTFLLIFLEVVIILFIIFEVVVLDRTENRLANAYKEKTQLYKAINEMKQKTNDLIHFARTYAITGDEEFKEKYFAILNIENGVIARPKNYDSIYWDLDKEIQDTRYPNEKPQSLKDILNTLPFSKKEKEKLKLFENNSNYIVNLELRAFQSIQNNDKAGAIAILYSKEFHQAKQAIMIPIDEILFLLENRTNNEIELLEQKIKTQFKYIMIVGILFILGNILAYLILRQKVTTPIEYLTETISNFKNNTEHTEKKKFYNDEIGYMIEQFFEMQHSINDKTNNLEQSKKDIEQILSNILLPILITSREKRTILYANKYAEKQYEMSLEQIIGSTIESVYTLLGDKEEILNVINRDGLVANLEQKYQTNSGRKFDALLSVTPIIYKDEPAYIGMITDITTQKEMELEIRKIHKHTKESIEYAALIQSSLIPDNSLFKKYFSDYFVIWHPKDIVGGDIYFFEELKNKDECLVMVIDCTGHGVPGAFVTMLVKAIERQIITEINHEANETVSPAQILNIFNKTMKHLLKQEDKNSISNTGFDGQVVYYNKSSKLIKCASARNSIFYHQDGEVLEIKGDRHSVGYKESDGDFEFTEHTIDASQDISIYLSTDGYWDQIGGEYERSFGKKRFKALIDKIKDNTMEEQQKEFIDTLQNYQGDIDRQDDIAIIGIKISANG